MCVSAGRLQPVITRPVPSDGDQTACKDAEKELSFMGWGLIPSFTKDRVEFSTLLNTINARDDNLTTSPIYRRLLNKRRCVVLCEGFFEWLKSGKMKIPYYIRPKRKEGESKFPPLLLMAGLYDIRHLDDGTEERTFTIITTEPNSEFRWLHDRMPVILTQDEADQWMDASRPFEDVVRLVRPAPPNRIEWYQVSQEVNKIGNDSPACTKPIPEKGKITGFFQRSPKKAAAPASCTTIANDGGDGGRIANADVTTNNCGATFTNSSGTAANSDDGCVHTAVGLGEATAARRERVESSVYGDECMPRKRTKLDAQDVQPAVTIHSQ
eukprot:Opistho-2@85774